MFKNPFDKINQHNLPPRRTYTPTHHHSQCTCTIFARRQVISFVILTKPTSAIQNTIQYHLN